MKQRIGKILLVAQVIPSLMLFLYLGIEWSWYLGFGVAVLVNILSVILAMQLIESEGSAHG